MMSQEQLNRAQVSTVFEQVGSETVARGVGMDPILQSGASGGLAAGVIDGLGADRMIRRMVTAPGLGKPRRLRLRPRSRGLAWWSGCGALPGATSRGQSRALESRIPRQAASRKAV